MWSLKKGDLLPEDAGVASVLLFFLLFLGFCNQGGVRIYTRPVRDSNQ